MNLFKKVTRQETLGKYILLFLSLFLMNNSIASSIRENLFLVKSKEIDLKLDKFYSQHAIEYGQYDKLESQLKIFFGFDSEYPENSFYPDLLIINDSYNIRDLYGKKLDDMTINGKIYNINKWIISLTNNLKIRNFYEKLFKN